MANFKQIRDPKTIDARYANKITVIVESDEDVQVFMYRWFSQERNWLEFRSADQGLGGGCKQVIRNTQAFRLKKVKAFGIVDRDALLQCDQFDLLFETDNKKHITAKPFGEYIHVLCRWELENYLLEPEELENILADSSKEAPRDTRSKQETVKELLAHCEVLIPVMSASILLHRNKCEALSEAFNVQITHRSDMDSQVRHQLSKHLGSDFLNLYNEYLSKIEAFSENHPENSEARWGSLNRIIDGKRILKRITHRYRLEEKIIYRLARAIKQRNQIDSEIRELVEYLKSGNQ
jgi:hypothetical protein